MKPIWKMTETEKTELAIQIILRVAESPDGVTIKELEADGAIHSSVYFALCYQGFLEMFKRNGLIVFKIPDGKDEKNSSQPSKKMI